MKVTKEQFEIMSHTAHRTANGRYCGNSTAMKELVKQGLMHSVGNTSFCPDEYFCLTKRGSVVLAAAEDSNDSP